MKLLFVLCVLMVVALSSAKPQFNNPRGCIYINGHCHEGCKEGTHSYTPGCGPIIPEATCDEPHPKIGDGDVCDYSSCYCDSPTVRDKVSGNCVTLDKCPKKLPKQE
ncbi:unnamed protein product [Arctia plantaginis]|uniref:Uncharacterized protein n=1 Tax=Arctia plantaginis TaxID=874455 RepID=A0A8S0ZKC0_ARCPL|nr:unnamed protein product [Arctia plantaginis]